MSSESKKEYIAFLRLRYLKVRRKERSVILDEIERNFAIHRKSAVRLMVPKRVTKVTRGRKRIYDLEAMRASTVDRILKPFRASLRRKQNTGTKPGRLLKNIIPVKPLDFNITNPVRLRPIPSPTAATASRGNSRGRSPLPIFFWVGR